LQAFTILLFYAGFLDWKLGNLRRDYFKAMALVMKRNADF
jgi:hypothetical protein